MSRSSDREILVVLGMSRLQRVLLAAVSSGRCRVILGRFPTLMVDNRVLSDQRDAQELIAAGLIEPVVTGEGELVARAVLSRAGERALCFAESDAPQTPPVPSPRSGD